MTDDLTNHLIADAGDHANRAAIAWCRTHQSSRPDHEPAALYLAGLVDVLTLALVKLPKAEADGWLKAVETAVADERRKRQRAAH